VERDKGIKKDWSLNWEDMARGSVMPRQGHAKATRLRGYVLARDSSNRLLSFQFLYFEQD
jgi:hypothetical protein